MKKELFYFNEFVIACSDSKFFCVFYAAFPVCGRRDSAEMIVSFVVGFAKKRIFDHRLCIYRICTCSIESHRVEGGEEAYVRNNGSVIFCVAVAVWGNIDHKADMEVWTSVDNSFCIFCDFAV